MNWDLWGYERSWDRVTVTMKAPILSWITTGATPDKLLS